MRKITTILSLLLLLMFFISSCVTDVPIETPFESTPEQSPYYPTPDEPTPSEPTDEYAHVFQTFQEFIAFVNQATMETARSSVKIRIRVINDQFVTEDEIYVSGFIFFIDSVHAHVMTVFEPFDAPSDYRFNIRVYDFMDREYTATLREADMENNIAAIRFVKPLVNPLQPASLSSDSTVYHEPLLMIGYHRSILNGMQMGILKDPSSINNLIKTTLIADHFARGSLIVNAKNDIIGMQSLETNEQGYAYAIHHDTMKVFIENYA